MNYLDGPRAMVIEINSNWNRRCKFCPNGNYARNSRLLEGEVFAKVVKEL
jgi:hypothetical protein